MLPGGKYDMYASDALLIKQPETLEVRPTGPSTKVLPFILALLFGLIDALSFRARTMPDSWPAYKHDFLTLSRITKRKRFNTEENGPLSNAVFQCPEI